MSRRAVGRIAAGVVLPAVLALTGCTHHASPTQPPSSPSASTPAGLGGGAGEQTSVQRSTIMTTPTPKLTAGQGVEIDKPCPYASPDDFRDAEGDRTVHSVQLVGTPVGCRYYFEYDPTVIIGEIRIQTFPTTTAAYNAVVVAANGHPEAYGDPSIAGGAVLLKLPLQGTATWACIFAKGKMVVTAHTRQTDVAQDAKNVALLIAPKVPAGG